MCTVLVVFTSQFAIIYSNRSIFMKLNDIIDAIHPMQSMLIKSTNPDAKKLPISTSLDFINSDADINDDSIPEDENNPYQVGAIEGVFLTNISYDYRECTSPESHVAWPLEGDIRSMTSDSLTCGMNSDTPFANFFRGDLWKRKFHPLIAKCTKLVVFGVAFGGQFVSDLDAHHVRTLVNATDLLERHNRCFFILTTDADIDHNAEIVEKYNDKSRSFIDPVVIGHNILIPLPEDILPYKNPRRNVKLLKYMGQYMFQEAETVIWQDAKFFRNDFVSKQPMDYRNMVEKDSCVTAVSLPVHKITVGIENIRRGFRKDGRYTAQYEHHCQTIIAALVNRPNVTDSSDNLIRQCDAYLQHVYQEAGTTDTMNHGLIDSAFIVWNHKTQACRDFSSTLRCTIMDQVQCHSDRDQVSIPFALYNMGVSGKYRPRKGDKLQKVDEKWDPRIHDLDFLVTNSSNPKFTKSISSDDVMLRVTRSSCHWYFSRLGNCRTDLTEDKPTVALLVVGSAKRYVFNGLTKHFINPLARKQGVKVDFYLMLSVKQGLAYRSTDEYMKHQTYDPVFAEIATEKDSGAITAYLFDKIRTSISLSGANVGGIHIQPQPMKLDLPQLRKKQLAAKKARPKEDSYYRFPTLDLRPEYRRRTAVANRNLLKLFLGLRQLWLKHLIASETYVGVKYDYVVVLREDVTWMADFNLQKLLDTNPAADAYVLSCDMIDPPMIANEYNDYGIVIKRSKATLIGRFIDHLMKTDLKGCHESVKSMVPEDVGCNGGMLMYYIMQRHNITVQRVSQSVFPIERTLNLNVDEKDMVCLHGMCQSKEAPLKIPRNMKNCTDIKFEKS